MRQAQHIRNGFTLLEVMVAVAIMAILLSVASIDYVRTLPQKRVRGAAFDVMARMRQARMLAASANAHTQVSISGNTITTWVDRNNNGMRDSGEETSMTVDPKVSMVNSPSDGIFDSRGMFTTASMPYMFIYMYAPNASPAYVYIFLSGHVELYYM